MSRVSESGCFVDLAMCDFGLLLVNLEALEREDMGKPQWLLTVWNARTPWRKIRRLTHWAMVRCWNARETVTHVDKYGYIHTSMMSHQSLLNTNCGVAQRSQSRLSFQILTLTLASCVTRANYLTSWYLISQKMGGMLKAILRVVMKSAWVYMKYTYCIWHT